MAKKKMLFIYNPKAGKGQIKNNLSDIIDIFGEQLSGFLTLGEKPPNNYQFAVQGICDAIKDMPHCIFRCDAWSLHLLYNSRHHGGKRRTVAIRH